MLRDEKGGHEKTEVLERSKHSKLDSGAIECQNGGKIKKIFMLWDEKGGHKTNKSEVSKQSEPFTSRYVGKIVA